MTFLVGHTTRNIGLIPRVPIEKKHGNGKFVIAHSNISFVSTTFP